MKCPQCQHDLRDTARFCDNCGLSIAAAHAPTIHDHEAAPSDPFVGRVLDSRYEFVKKLGEGGMGSVYRARRVHLAGEVAIKVLHGKYVTEEGAVERFRREARAASRLNHPNVVTIHDFGDAGGDDAPAYIVMELVEGESLGELLKREGSLAPERAVALLRDICAGVGAAHRKGIVHRDLKPDNVIVLPPDEDRERESVKVVDFGLAKLRDIAAGNTLTRTGALVGTPYYMSPEQCRGEPLDARADVYSLGAMLYEMLAGTPPFVASNLADLVTKHLHEPAPALPAEHNVGPELDAVCARALAKDPQARQADATQLSRELLEAERERVARREEEERARLEEEERRRREEEQEVARVAAAERARKQEEARQFKEAARRFREESETRRRVAEEEARRAEQEEAARRWNEQKKKERLREPEPAAAVPEAEEPKPKKKEAEPPDGVLLAVRRWIDGEVKEEKKAVPAAGRFESLRRWIDGDQEAVPSRVRPAAWKVAGFAALAFTLLMAALTTLMRSGSRLGGASYTSTAPTPSPTPAESAEERFAGRKLRVDQSPAAEAARMEAETGNRPLNSNDPEFLYLYGRAVLLTSRPREASAAFYRASEKLAATTSSAPEALVTELLSARVAVSLIAEDLNTARAAARQLQTHVEANRNRFAEQARKIEDRYTGTPLNARDPQLLYDFGRALLFSGEYRTARAAFRAAIKQANEGETSSYGQLKLDAHIALIAAEVSANDIAAARESANLFDENFVRRPSPAVTPF